MSKFSLSKLFYLERCGWVFPFGVAVVLQAPVVLAAPPLPVPSKVWVSEGGADLLPLSDGGLKMTIDQQTQKAIYRWESFDIGKKNTVEFKQPGRSSIALNRVVGAARPSEILGKLLANGSVYLINQNGIVFGEGSQVNVGSLVASTLDVDDDLVKSSSIINAINDGKPAFSGTKDGSFISVEEGAELITEGGGRILMFAPSITNNGEIKTPDGQAILAAAKDKVYLTAVEDPNIRGGLLVEVDTGGDVTNVGKIVAERGNITLLGMAVNQRGRLTATTSVNQNGSIRLVARDKVEIKEKERVTTTVAEELLGLTVDLENAVDDGEKVAVASRTGKVVLGENSVTEVVTDQVSTTKASDQAPQPVSKIDIVGRQIHVKENAKVTSTSGEINIAATSNSADPFKANNVDSESYLYLAENSKLDVSGLKNVSLAMERNSLAVELRDSDALKNSPVQKGSKLSGKTIYVDLRKGTKIADIQGALGQVQKGASERMTSGGTVDIRSEGDVVQREGSSIDISAGSIKYREGKIKSSQLVSNGEVYDVATADPNRRYDGILDDSTAPRNDKWNIPDKPNDNVNFDGPIVKSFVEGKKLGSLKVQAATVWLDPNGVKAEQIVGPYQRDKVKQLSANGGVFIDLSHYINSQQNVRFVSEQAVIDSIEKSLLEAPSVEGGARPMVSSDLLISSNYLRNTGALKTRIDTKGAVSIEDSIRGNAGAGLSLSGSSIDVSADILLRGGDVSLRSITTPATDNAAINLAPDVVIDTRGLWVNDNPLLNGTLPDAPIVTDGGHVDIVADGDLILGKGVSIDTSGGAYVDQAGKLVGGKGGDITLGSTNTREGAHFSSEASLRSYGIEQGGSLTLKGNRFLITGDSSVQSTLEQMVLSNDFFQQGGFSAYNLHAQVNGIEIAPGTVITPRARNYTVGQAGGSANLPFTLWTENLSSVGVVPDFVRKPVDISFKSTLGVSSNPLANSSILMGTGSRINADPGASISFTTDDSIFLDGVISAPAGDISLAIQSFDGLVDKGFLRNQAIWLGENAVLAAPGVLIDKPSSITFPGRYRDAMVMDAGSISLLADRGYIIGKKNSKINLSGAVGVVDRIVSTGDLYSPFAVKKIIASANAGKLIVSGQEGIYIDSDMEAKSVGVGGTFDLTFGVNGNRVADQQTNNELGAKGLPKFIFSDRKILVEKGLESGLDQSLAFGDNIDDGFNGRAVVSSEKLKAAGFDSLQFTARDYDGAQGSVYMNSGTSLHAKNQIVFNTKAIDVGSGDVDIKSNYVSLGSNGATLDFAVTPTGGDGRLTVSADLVDLKGNLAIRGTDEVVVNSTGDIRLEGVQESGANTKLTGRFSVANNLDLSAKQIYPSTFSDFEITAGNRVSIFKQGAPSPVLSAAGRLKIEAPTILQSGVLKAPFGEILLKASKAITLTDGSVTSVSGENQTVLFGQTQLTATDWFYSIGNRKVLFKDGLPVDKKVGLDAPDIDMAAGATVDLSGGGKLLAYEFVPGPDGTIDTLNGVDGAFAVLPNYKGNRAPIDKSLASSSNFTEGQQIVLANSANGLAAGEYTLLPARYALLPGAYLITPAGDSASVLPGGAGRRVDGAPVVAGQIKHANTPTQNFRWSNFVVEPGTVANTRSKYLLSDADEFFAQQAQLKNAVTPMLPQDAGALVLKAIDRLILDATIVAPSDHIGRGASVDIQANEIAVVKEATVATPGVISIAVDKLNALNVESLLLGGSRKRSSLGVEIDVDADKVIISKDVELEAPDIILAATDKVEVRANAVVKGAGRVGAGQDALLVDGDGALLRASAGEQAPINRKNESDDPSKGEIFVDKTASVVADGSITFDASKDVGFEGDFSLAEGGSLQLGANKISLGETEGINTGLVLSKENLALLKADELVLNSRSSIDLYGEFDFASDNLVLRGSSLQGFKNAGKTTTLSAKESLTLSNINKRSLQDTATGSGSLEVIAKDIIVESGDMAITGFDHVSLTATSQLRGKGEGKLETAANVVVTTPEITGEAGANTKLISAGIVELVASEFQPDQVRKALDSLGAQLTVEGERVIAGTLVSLPSGQVTLHATGDGVDDNVTLVDGAKLHVAGGNKQFGETTTGVKGGSVALISDAGDVVMGVGSEVDVSATTADAGKLILKATKGKARLQGTLLASSAGGAGGSFDLDVATLSDFSALNETLSTAGFNHGLTIRQRSGDLEIAAQDTVNADEISLTIDNGKLSVAGVLDASGESGGRIDLFAKSDLSLLPSARLLANATADEGKAGKVFLSSKSGNLSLMEGAFVNVSSGKNISKGGSLILRAPRALANNDVQISSLRGSVVGAERLAVHAVERSLRVDTLSSIDTELGEANDFMKNEASIRSRLGGLAKADNFRLLPEIEIHSDGDLTVTNEIDLLNNRFNGDIPGVLTLSSVGNLTFQRSLSDGFSITKKVRASRERNVDTLETGESWSYNLIAGVDSNSANLFDVVTPKLANSDAGTGNLVLEKSVKIRTGTGDINIVAGNDVIQREDTTIYVGGEDTGRGDYYDNLNNFEKFGIPGLAAFPTNGGDLNVSAGRNIQAPVSGQLFTDWLQRLGDQASRRLKAKGSTWAVVFKDFNQGMAAFGGGDVNIQAGNDVVNLNVSLPTTGKQLSTSNDPLILGGGDLVVNVGGDIRSGRFLVGRGDAHIDAGGAITTSEGSENGLILALGDASADVNAVGDVEVAAVTNPTIIPLSTLQNNGFRSVYNYSPSFFFTYDEKSAVKFASLTKDINFDNNLDTTEFKNFGDQAEWVGPLSIFPGDLKAVAYQGNIEFGGGMSMFPAEQGGVELLAGGDIFTESSDVVAFNMSGLAPERLPNAASPLLRYSDLFGLLGADTVSSGDRAVFYADYPLHGQDKRESVIFAGRDIYSANKPFYFSISEQAKVAAGRDISNVSFSIQNDDVSDISTVQAGRNILFPSVRDAGGDPEANQGRIEVFGPGRLDVMAGKDIDLGASRGISSQGNIYNSGLSKEGADISILAGLTKKPDYQGFIKRYFRDANSYDKELIAFVTSDNFPDDIISHISSETNKVYTGKADAIADFKLLNQEQQRSVALSALGAASEDAQRVIVLDTYFNELRLAGIQDVTQEIQDPSKDGFARGFAVVEALFPGSTSDDNPYMGDVMFPLSGVQSPRGNGEINILAPGGNVEVGGAVVPKFGAGKSSDELGIISGGSGGINVMADKNIEVNISRIFGLGGGSTTLWSTKGDIDAGRGAKSALSVPPPSLSFDESNGDVIEETPPAVAGSGIQCASTASSTCSIYLFAPRGVVDAGEAGINADGDLLVAATEVLNADNIDAGGVTVGIPVSTGVSANVAGASSSGTTATDSAQESLSENMTSSATSKQESIGFLSVEVIGIGDDEAIPRLKSGAMGSDACSPDKRDLESRKNCNSLSSL